MSRGGERKGAGRKSTWKSGCRFEDTKLIRVPSAIADEILDIAHKLDAGESPNLETKSREIEQVQSSQLNPLESEGSHHGLDKVIKIDIPISIFDRVIKFVSYLSNPSCPKCGSVRVIKDGHQNGKQRYKCSICSKKFAGSSTP